MSEKFDVVWLQHRATQDKYVYFILTAAGAGIALVVHQTANAVLCWSQIPLAFGVVFWGLSFYFGCRYVVHSISVLGSNLELLDARTAVNNEQSDRVVKGIKERIEEHWKRQKRLGVWQFRLLVLGAASYVSWRLWEMVLRSLHHAGTITSVP